MAVTIEIFSAVFVLYSVRGETPGPAYPGLITRGEGALTRPGGATSYRGEG